MLEGERFDELLQAGADLPLVAPGVQTGNVWDDAPEELEDLVKAGLVLFSDGGGDGSVDGAKASYWQECC